MISPTTKQQRAILKHMQVTAPKFTSELFAIVNPQYAHIKRTYYQLLVSIKNQNL